MTLPHTRVMNLMLHGHQAGAPVGVMHVGNAVSAIFKPGKATGNRVFQMKPSCGCSTIRNDRHRPGPYLPKGY